MPQPGYDINDLYQEAQTRWLKPSEVHFILENHDKYQLTEEASKQPTSGSLFLFNKRVLRFFRKDGHNWRKKKDGRTVGEAHERLKVGNVETLNCYYAHGEENPNFQRRSYWILDPSLDHIVLVHYRDISKGKFVSGCAPQLSPGSSSGFVQSPASYSNQILSSSSEHQQNLLSPGSVEVSSEIANRTYGVDSSERLDGTADMVNLNGVDVSQALRRLEEQLSLNDDSLKDIGPFYHQDEYIDDSHPYNGEISNSDHFATFQKPESIVQSQLYGHSVMQGAKGEHHPEALVHDTAIERKESLSWKEVLEACRTLPGYGSREKESSEYEYVSITKGKPLFSSGKVTNEECEDHYWFDSGGNAVENSSLLLESHGFPAYSSVIGTHDISTVYSSMCLDQGQGIPLESDASLTIAPKQKFTISEISPEWGYATESTKVIIVGSFLCDPSESSWACMFGDIKVPLQIVQDGVIRCEAPPHLPGKVTLCITASNRESCSEVREFNYRANNTVCTRCNSSSTEAMKSPEELLLLVRLAQMLLTDLSTWKGEHGDELLRKLGADDDSWSYVIESLLVGIGTSSGTIYWLLEEFLKDKLQQWLSSRTEVKDDQNGCSLSKKDQGIIHVVAGLGFEWALNSILSCGVSVDFRDITGWTALHWASRFGREKMVAALIASGASAGAVTDPSTQDPNGKTPASIAAFGGHKGLAGYLSEVALTRHLSSLTLVESELSKGSAEVEAERTVNSISNANSLSSNEDQLSLKDTLAAVRNAAQAAARIQSAFRAHSFKKRHERDSSRDEYGIHSNDLRGFSAISKLAFRNSREHNTAALSIQKNFRGWKGRKDFLSFRKKVVKIQAHVRGYHVRKHAKVICWAVGILDKVVLRWRRKGVGLRGFRHETESIDESEDEDIIKVFRKQNVEGAIDEAVARVLSMAESPEARQQYRRMLEKYRQAKAELNGSAGEAVASNSLGDVYRRR